MSSKHPIVLALGYSEAAMLLRSPEGSRVKAILSIHGEREFGVASTIPTRLDLPFDDVAAGNPNDPISMYHARMRRQADAENGLVRMPPTLEDARAIVHFADATREIDGIVLCHCSAGISRSPAAAILCVARWLGPGAERASAEAIAKMRPAAFPHEDLVGFGDMLMQRGGRLIAAVRGVFFGDVAGETAAE